MINLLPALLLRFKLPFLLLIPLSIPARAAENEYRFEAFYSIMNVDRRGNIHVTETLSYDFTRGKFSSAKREVSLEDFQEIEFVSVSSPNTAVQVERFRMVSGWSRRFELHWTFPETDQPKLFHLEYVLKGVVSKEGDYNLIRWSPLGDGLPVAVRKYVAEIRLPWLFDAGIETSPSAERRLLADKTILTYAAGPLPKRARYDVMAKFPIMIDTAPPRRAGGYAKEVLRAVVPGYIVLLVITLLIWRKWGRVVPEPISGPVTDSPDINLTIGEAAMLVYRKSSRWRIIAVAILLDLARRGFLYFERRSIGSRPTPSTPQDVRVMAKITDAAVSSWEYRILGAFLHEAFLGRISRQKLLWDEILESLRRELQASGLIDSRRVSMRRVWVGLATALLVISFGCLAYVLLTVLKGGLAPAILAVGGSLMFLIAGFATETASARGLRIRLHVAQWARALRERIDELRETDPVAAYTQFTSKLPELIMDPGVDRSWMLRLQTRLNIAASGYPLPTWIQCTNSIGEPVATVLSIGQLFGLYLESSTSPGR